VRFVPLPAGSDAFESGVLSSGVAPSRSTLRGPIEIG
jgi:hypothetical protein